MKIASLFNLDLAQKTAQHLKASVSEVTLRLFPDGEFYLRFNEELAGEDLLMVDSLNQPNTKILALILAAQTAKELGARGVKLITPYLAYMRQDKRFNPGEAMTAKLVAKLLSDSFDGLITVDPHLHRYHTLGEIYKIDTQVVSSAPAIAGWIKSHINNPLLIGPDQESEQWVKQIADIIKAPYVVAIKIRHGDHDVEVTLPDLKPYLQHQAVLIDDIISSGQTMIQAIKLINALGMSKPYCIGVHAIFAQDSYESILAQNVADIITCNTILHESNRIDLSSDWVKALRLL